VEAIFVEKSESGYFSQGLFVVYLCCQKRERN